MPDQEKDSSLKVPPSAASCHNPTLSHPPHSKKHIMNVVRYVKSGVFPRIYTYIYIFYKDLGKTVSPGSEVVNGAAGISRLVHFDGDHPAYFVAS
jgi:hypothetical protein